MTEPPPRAAILDYGLGNLFSVQRACEHAGLRAEITSSREAILAADAVILPGVGAYGDAMATLERRNLVGVLRDVAASDKPLMAVCLGIQLLMTESHEFGRHKGLGIIEGPVVRLDSPAGPAGTLKVPQVGWNRIRRVPGSGVDPWRNTALDGLADGEYMYFVHSFVVRPADPAVVLSTSRYGQIEFCSSLQHRNIFACQFHPERSGKEGLRIYRSFAAMAASRRSRP